MRSHDPVTEFTPTFPENERKFPKFSWAIGGFFRAPLSLLPDEDYIAVKGGGWVCFPTAQQIMPLKSSKAKKSPMPLTGPTAKGEIEELDALNARARRKNDTARLMEASIEAKAKKRRSQEAPASASWKSST